ncbi:MAG: hypothetical protein C0592_06465, partial [Marinilabiliales bacterium]
ILVVPGTYQFRVVVSSGICPSVNSTSATIVVDPATVAGTVSGPNSNICLGSSTGTMTLSGHTGSVLKWQVSANGGATWTDIANTTTTLSITPGTSGTYMFRAQVQSGVCTSAFSGAFTVTVDDLSVGGTLTGSNTICAGSNTGTMTLTGYVGAIVKWQRSDDGGSTWTDIVNTSATYDEVLATAGTYIYRVEVSNGTCASSFSSTVSIVVDPLSVGGAVAGTNTQICLGDPTGTMTLSGYTGTIVKWQKRVDGGAWTDIANTTNTYGEVPVSAGTWDYRVEVQSGSCGSAFATEFTVVVDPLSVGGDLSGTTTLCAGNNTGTMTLTSYTGAIVEWQRSDNGGSTWTSIANTSATYDEIIPAAGTYLYRVVVTSGVCSSSYSDTLVIVVDPVTVPGVITGNNISICAGTSSGNMTLGGYTGAILKWQKRVDMGAWTDITNTTDTMEEVIATPGTWDYRAIVQSGTCDLDSSDYVSILVSEASNGGTLSGGNDICASGSTGTMTVLGYVGSVTKWQYSYNSGAWADIANITDTLEEVLSTSGTYDYRVVVQSGACAEAYSNEVNLEVFENSVGGSLSIVDSVICEGETTDLIVLSSFTGTINKWQRRIDGAAWTDLANTTATYSEIATPAGLYEYRVEVQNGICTVAYSDTAQIDVLSYPVASFSYIINGLVVDFTNTSTNATSYDWNFGDGSAHSNLVDPSHTYPTSNTYNVILTAYNDICSHDTSSLVDVVDAVIELDDNTYLTMFPNPSNGEFNITYYGTPTSAFEMQIFDMTGRLIRTEDLSYMTSGSVHTVSLGAVNAGFYNVRFTFEDNVFNQIMVIE